MICRAFPPLAKFRRSPLHSGSKGGHVTTSRHQHPLGAGQFLHISRKCFSLFLYTIRQRKPRPYMFSQLASSQASLIAFRLKWFSIGCLMSCMQCLLTGLFRSSPLTHRIHTNFIRKFGESHSQFSCKLHNVLFERIFLREVLWIPPLSAGKEISGSDV